MWECYDILRLCNDNRYSTFKYIYIYVFKKIGQKKRIKHTAKAIYTRVMALYIHILWFCYYWDMSILNHTNHLQMPRKRKGGLNFSCRKPSTYYSQKRRKVQIDCTDATTMTYFNEIGIVCSERMYTNTHKLFFVWWVNKYAL